MGTPHGSMPGPRQRALSAAGYLVLLALGAVQGVVGSFQYSRSPVPLVAIVLAVVIFITCLLCGWGMGTFAGALLPAIGWVAASFVLSMPNSNGSVIITASTAGEWYLYGGIAGAAAGTSVAFIIHALDRARHR